MSQTNEYKPKKSASQQISLLSGFLAGGLASCGAVTFTNPIELVKTRMQLQGELLKRAQVKTIPYHNPVQALYVIYKNEGLRGLQKGLFCAYIYQIALNGCRYGLYEPIRKNFNQIFYPNQDPHIIQKVPINILSGALSGMAGAALGSPLYLIKTRMQSYTASSTIQVGQQTHYNNFYQGLINIYKNENGIKGLFRGVDAAVFRTGVGSAVQLPSYYLFKHKLLDSRYFNGSDSFALHLSASTLAGVLVSIVMNPFDVVLTRIYNQKGNLYRNPIDCFIKTIKTEGFGALYKGLFAQMFRMAPHSILCLIFMEQTMRAAKKLEDSFSITFEDNQFFS
ncbi:Oac1p [Ascoidea rubescens DSM 1968]|uniref:Mitochondrial carrier n=1 Tax=Ascoidea rubescens DSM 1968 TaxID=1344418 RepID=A0A1D2V9T9_9ASCO|nr:mitochondrial carrier [Ascoidea rubescens DSM 1968]ODV58422.1 mitochondrial carrier [Ascoidea rubescens DSM 1968]